MVINCYLQQRIERAVRLAPMHIVWAARWEHDKNAEDFLAALKILADDNLPFRISVLGQSFRNTPPVFEEIRNTFSDRIVRWGYQVSRAQYWEALAEADIFVSTANHEFFGLAAAEAIAAGLRPLFPNRLAYPELLAIAVDSGDVPNYLFETTATDLACSLSKLHWQRTNGSTEFDLKSASRMIDAISWDRRASQLDDALLSVENAMRHDASTS